MIAADVPTQRPTTARLLIVDAQGRIVDTLRMRLIDAIRPGDVIVANDAATLPASLRAIHERTGANIELRLAARRSLEPDDIQVCDVVVFGEGDHRTRTENRLPPPTLQPGDRLRFGELTAVVEALLDHPRLARIVFQAPAAAVWRLLAREGRPIQYAHVRESLALWDVWTPIAALPAAFEPPSAGFAIDWQLLAALRAKGARFVTLTHAAGISSTGDVELDRRLPFDEPYVIPPATARAIVEAKADQRRVIAIGTTVTRALEHAAGRDGVVRSGPGLANQRLGPATRLRVVDAILSGTHEAGTSHYELLRAFVDDEVLHAVDAKLESAGYRTHEFGDSILIEKDLSKNANACPNILVQWPQREQSQAPRPNERTVVDSPTSTQTSFEAATTRRRKSPIGCAPGPSARSENESSSPVAAMAHFSKRRSNVLPRSAPQGVRSPPR